MPGYFQYYRPFPVYAGSEVRKVVYEKGNIVIDLIDRGTSKVIWRGVAKGEVSNPEKALMIFEKLSGKFLTVYLPAKRFRCLLIEPL